jgi:PAS domain S-box-containing protein
MHDEKKSGEHLLRELVFPILEMMPATICLQAPDYTIGYANRLFRDTFGDPEGRACYEILHGRTDPCEECMPFRVLESGEPGAREWTSSDGSHFLVHYYPFEDVHGERLVLEMGLDISERKRAEDSLKQSELELRRITNNMLDMVGQADSRGLFTYVSPSYHNILGYEREELLGHSVFELIHPDDLRGVMKTFMRAGEALRPGKAEYRYRHANGDYIWLETIGNPLFDEAGELLGATFTTRDVSERRQAVDALRDSEEKFRLLSDQSLMGIQILQNGVVKYVNEASTRITGYTKEEIMAWKPENYASFIHPDDMPLVLEQSRRKEAGEEDLASSYEWRLITGMGETRWIESFSKTIHYGEGPADFVMITDITDRHNIEEERAAREEQMRDFLDIASHELRHPITVLKGYTAILANQGDRLDQGTREVIHSIIDHGADRLNSLVTGLLDISHIERDKFTITRGRYALEPIIDKALEEMRVRGFNNEFSKENAADLPECCIDAEKLEQLLVILLENAVKYSVASSPIEVETLASSDEITVCVADRGIGIPVDARKTVFERFYQVEDPSHHSKPGMGMGLYIAHHIVEAHGGRIWCEPRPGEGTFMRFTIPL